MPITKGLDVSIHADGKPLEEREDTSIEEDDVSKITRYIEAKSGQLFVIKFDLPPEDQFEGDVICCDIYVDGKLLDSLLLQKGSPLPVEQSNGLLMPDGTVRLFQFAEVTIEESNPATRAKKDRHEHKDVGKIVVKVHHKNMGEASTLYVDPRGYNRIDTVDEKTLKGQSVSHSVGLAPPVQADGRSLHFKTSFVDPEGVPFAVFTFLYRSAEKLATIFISTPTASPEPEQDLADKEAEDLTLDEIREVQRQAREARQASLGLIRGFKREFTEDESEDGPLRQSRRQRRTTYLVMRDDDDGEFEEVEAPVRPSQAATQLD